MSGEKKNTITSFYQAIKNIWEREGKKAELKKGPKSKKPSGYRARQFGRVAFWVAFVFMFFVVVVNVFGSGNAEGKKNEVTIPEANPATSQAAVEYARDFAQNYFTWQKGEQGKKERRDRLVKYLADGLDQDAGLEVGKLEWDSSFQNADLKRIDENGSNRAYITLLVNTKMKKVTQKEVETTVGEGDAQTVVTENVQDVAEKPVSKYLVIPVAYHDGTYGIYELPRFTNMKEETNLKISKAVGLKGYEGNTEKVKEFLETFFGSYADDNSTKISYMLTEGTRVDGLEGMMRFEGLTDTKINRNDKDELVVFTKVKFVDPETNVIFNTDYQLTIVEKDGKYLVKGFNDFTNKEQVRDDEIQSNKKENQMDSKKDK